MAPNLADLAVRSAHTLRAFGQRIPVGGGVLAQSLSGVVSDRQTMITGASQGIGRATALQIGRAGGTVILVARTRAKLEEVAREIEALGGTAHVHPCDLSDTDDVERMADEVIDEHGLVDILVNNAGRSIRRSVHNSYDRFHDYQRTMQLNYFAPVKLILKLLPIMRAEKSRAHHQHLDDRPADEHAAVQRLPRLEGRPRRVQPLDRSRGDRRWRPLHDRVHAARAHPDDRADEAL